MPVPVNVQASLPSSSAAYGAPISVGAPSFAPPGGATSSIVREVVTGVVVAVLAALLLKHYKSG